MISIICPIHNRLEATKDCLKSLSTAISNSSDTHKINIIFVDDGSTDGTAEWINTNYPQVMVLKGDGNLWWSGAMNMGAQYALEQGAEYVFLINNDNLFEKDCIEKLINLAMRKNIEIVGSKIMDLSTNQVWALGGYFNSRTGEFGMYKSPKEVKNSYYAVDWIPGMGTLIHRTVFEKIGYWNEKDFPQYCGDTDFILRAKERDIIPYVSVESIIWNDVTKTGIIHNGSFVKLIRSLYSIKSPYDICVTVRFLFAHSTSFVGIIKNLGNKYGRYIGGFVKHKILNIFKKDRGKV